jgi:hypothetical protein
MKLKITEMFLTYEITFSGKIRFENLFHLKLSTQLYTEIITRRQMDTYTQYILVYTVYIVYIVYTVYTYSIHL